VIVAFDLDDTLYPEEDFVKSGFRAVARVLHQRFQIDEDEAVAVMWTSLERNGRGRQFDEVVAFFDLSGRQSVKELVRTYRHHIPSISLPRESTAVLEQLKSRPLYVVTDGHKIVQQNKIDALGLAPWLRHAYLTHRYGIENRKPSVHVFELMIRRECCRPEDLVYVGDDPSKDFRGLRPLGVRTIRVRTGRHSEVVVPASQDAEYTMSSLAGIPDAVLRMEEEAAADRSHTSIEKATIWKTT
jgi:putative hydrolase of the HAD superfamily